MLKTVVLHNICPNADNTETQEEQRVLFEIQTLRFLYRGPREEVPRAAAHVRRPEISLHVAFGSKNQSTDPRSEVLHEQMHMCPSYFKCTTYINAHTYQLYAIYLKCIVCVTM